MKVETVEGHAQLASVFLSKLIKEGVSRQDAISLTGSYLSTVVLGARLDPPKEPWEER